MLVTIVIPTLDEEQGLPRVLQALPIQALRQAGHEVQVLVVDGGSLDRTREVAEAWGARVMRVRRGYGRQYRAAFATVPRGVVATLDADATYPAQRLADLVDLLLRQELDFLTVNRFAGMDPQAMSGLHNFGNSVLSGVTRTLFGVPVADSQSGMWVFRREILPYLHLHADGMAFSEELKIEAFLRFRAREVPGTYATRVGRAKLRSYRDGLGNLFYLFLKKARWLLGRP